VANKSVAEKVKNVAEGQDIAMKKNRANEPKGTDLISVESQLRSLAEVEVPETLKERLFAAVKQGWHDGKRQSRFRSKHRRWGFTAAAAVILIFALMSVVKYGLSAPSQLLPGGLNDTSLCYARIDENSLLCDQNSAYVEKSLPFDVKLIVPNGNEPTY